MVKMGTGSIGMELHKLQLLHHRKRADVCLPVWSRGQPAALDVTVISPMQQ